MDKQLKNILLGTGFGVTLFVLLINFQQIYQILESGIGLLSPLLIGGVIAFVLNVPMTQIEEFLNKMDKKRKAASKRNKDRSWRGVSLFLTLLFIIGILILLCMIVIPQMTASIASLIGEVEKVWPKWMEALGEGITWLEKEGIDGAWLTDMLNKLEQGDFFKMLQKSLGNLLPALTGTISSIASRTFNIMLAFIMTIYLLLDKERMAGFTTRLIKAFFPKKTGDKLVRTGRLLCKIYADFFSRQCLEAVVLGAMMGITFAICRLPYAGLVAVLTALLSFIPYVGSFLSCAIGAICILMISPMKAIVSIIVFQVVQFIENQFVYPRVVGSAVGLPPLLTLLAVFVGGGLFGVLGMIFFIPLTATVYALLKESMDERLRKKKNTISP